MNKIKEIILSWSAMVNPTEEQKQDAEERLKICIACEHWKINALNMEYCEKCGCLTKAKVFSPKGLQACPEGKWNV
jgi:hypothetical protein